MTEDGFATNTVAANFVNVAVVLYFFFVLAVVGVMVVDAAAFYFGRCCYRCYY